MPTAVTAKRNRISRIQAASMLERLISEVDYLFDRMREAPASFEYDELKGIDGSISLMRKTLEAFVRTPRFDP